MKACGKSGILTEMVKGCGGEIRRRLRLIPHYIMYVDGAESPPRVENVSLVPTPKKGDLTQCDVHTWNQAAGCGRESNH